MFRVKVMLTSERGNPKEITTICQSKEEADRRVAMYKDRYEGADIFIEELKDAS